jgi:hypothetical protein
MSSLYRLVREHFNSSLRQQNKEFGIEIEVENVPGLHIPGGIWETTGDDSLGNDTSNGELVLSSPLNFKEAMAAIRVADRHLKEHHPDHHFSMRTSVHVHMNVQQYSLKQILDILTLYWLYENQLVRYCGPDREGNFYCLRFSDSEALAYKIYAACLYHQNSDSLRTLDLLGSMDHKYSAVNTAPLIRYGSLEFRSMRGTSSPVTMKRWLTMLSAIRDEAVSEDFSIFSEHPVERAHKIFGKYTKYLVKGQEDREDIVSTLENIREILAMLPQPREVSRSHRHSLEEAVWPWPSPATLSVSGA